MSDEIRIRTLDEHGEPVVEKFVFEPERFEAFCGKLKIDSKELGQVPLTFLGTQRYVIEQIAEGLGRGIHTFVILKGRQLGISTVLLALSIYWFFKHKGLKGAVVTDTDDNRELFRSYVDDYINSLPKDSRAPVKRHNRVQILFRNRSRAVYMVAGTKKQGGLGRAKDVNFLMATECSSWGDEEGFLSLMNTLAQKNPNRLYLYESTARGYNMFYQAWETAKESSTQMAIFVGWWRNGFYSWPEDSPEYKEYWDGTPTSEERVWMGEVFEQYGHEITANQLAWWRWYVKEHMQGDESMALQEMPPTEEYAFQLSGSKFFSVERVNLHHKRALEQKCIHFRYVFGLNFEDTQFIETTEEHAEVTLWETPVFSTEPGGVNGRYTLGADPAYGSSEWADEFAASILRCYADKVVQVAEVGSTAWNEQQFAWVIAHLAGWYGDCMLNLEMQGPGGAVFNELWNLKMKAATIPRGDPRAGAFDVLGRIRDYLYKRQDSMNGNFAYQWQTNNREKLRMMSTFRSYWEREVIVINSPSCMKQFRNIHRQGDAIGGEGRAKDDRIIAAAIAAIAWNDWIMLEMQATHRTYALENRPREEIRPYSPLEKSVINYLGKQGVKFRGLT